MRGDKERGDKERGYGEGLGLLVEKYSKTKNFRLRMKSEEQFSV